MSTKRKIADCINIQINVGNYQHIAITKYAEEEIEYSSDQERKEKEDSLTASLVESVMRSMVSIPEKLKRGSSEAIEVEQSIRKAIPEWLTSNPVPNIAKNVNGAKRESEKIVSKQKENKDNAEISNVETRKHLESESLPIPEKKLPVTLTEDDLFEKDVVLKDVVLKVEEKKEVKSDFFTDSDSEELFN